MTSNTTRLAIGLAAVLTLAGCGDSGASFSPITAAAAAPPAFLEEGKTYEFEYTNGSVPIWATVTVTEIDAHSGWVKVKDGSGRYGGSYWVNLANVVGVGSKP